MNEELRSHINERELFSNFKKAASDLVDATNIMGCDKYVATQIAATLQDDGSQRLFFQLLEDAIPDLLTKISPHDGRSEASVKLLQEIKNPSHQEVLPKGAFEGFSMGIASSHNTLIQSFFRIIKEASEQLVTGLNESALETDVSAYNRAKDQSREALEALLSMLNELGAEKADSDIVQRIYKSQTFLPFI